jgi:hypothetical protein
MHRSLILTLAALLTTLAVACGGAPPPATPPAALPAGAAECKQPAAGATTCEEGCNWDAAVSACMPTRGVIIENRPAKGP